MRSETDIAPDLFPETGFPAIHFKRLRFRHHYVPRAVRLRRSAGWRVLRTQLKTAAAPLPGRRQTVNGQVRVGQDCVVDNVVKKYGIRIKRGF